MRRVGKKGSEKYYIIISLILGLLILGISLMFIFREMFEDTVNWETCRQSVVLRSMAPEINKAGVNWINFKNQFPLKCRTEPITIGANDDAKKVIVDTINACWSLFGQGNLTIFPSSTLQYETYCVPCARIQFDSSVIDKYTGSKRIDLYPDIERKNMGDNFQITVKTPVSIVVFPRYVDSKKGELIIYFEQFRRVGGNPPVLSNQFWFQTGQDPDPYSEMKKVVFSSGLNSATMCDQFDGIPA